MFTNSSIDSHLKDALVLHSYDSAYVFGTNVVNTGLDASEYYFLVRDSYEEVEQEVFKLHETYVELNGLFKRKLVSCIEDQVMMSPDKKYLIYLRQEFGHFVLNTLMAIMAAHKLDPDATFVIFMDIPLEEDSEKQKLLRFLEKFLLNNSINFYFLRSSFYLDTLNVLEVNTKTPLTKKYQELHEYKSPISHYLVYKANNVHGIDTGLTTRNLSVKDIKDLIDEYVNDYSETSDLPNRKVYITRRVYDNELEAFANGEYKSNNVRIYSEHLLEKYLSSKGFEIVDFRELQEIQDQINIMRDTTVLIGATGTGLTNQLFMRDSQVVVELRVEHGGVGSPHWIPVEYFYMTSGKNHAHIAIDVKDKQATTAIRKLDRILDSYDLQTLANNRENI